MKYQAVRPATESDLQQWLQMKICAKIQFIYNKHKHINNLEWLQCIGMIVAITNENIV